MSADLYVRLKIGASKNGELPRYFVENMYLSTDFVLDGTIQWLPESTVLLDECPEREGWTKLSKYLVPIFSYDDMELQVQNMLKTYLGETAVTAYQMCIRDRCDESRFVDYPAGVQLWLRLRR